MRILFKPQELMLMISIEIFMKEVSGVTTLIYHNFSNNY